jgi:uncharacterized protein (DUF1778 family)
MTPFQVEVAPSTNRSEFLDDTDVSLEISFLDSDWPVLVQASKLGARLDCVMAVRRNADGRTIVDYAAREKGQTVSKFAMMATPETTWDAIHTITTHLLINARGGQWGYMVTELKDRYTLACASKATRSVGRDKGWITVKDDKPTMPGPILSRMPKAKVAPVNDAPVPQSVVDGIKSLREV